MATVKENNQYYKDAMGNVHKHMYAMKVMDKAKLYQMRSVEAVKQEMNILSSIIHPFVVNL